MVRGPYFTGNGFLFECIYKSCDDELELFMPVNSGINLTEKLNERRSRKRDDPFDRSLNSVIYSVVITLFDVKKRRWSSAVDGDSKAPF